MSMYTIFQYRKIHKAGSCLPEQPTISSCGVHVPDLQKVDDLDGLVLEDGDFGSNRRSRVRFRPTLLVGRYRWDVSHESGFHSIEVRKYMQVRSGIALIGKVILPLALNEMTLLVAPQRSRLTFLVPPS